MAASQTRPVETPAVWVARRREAALRLPPLPCGCHDPESIEHRDGRCRYPSFTFSNCKFAVWSERLSPPRNRSRRAA